MYVVTGIGGTERARALPARAVRAKGVARRRHVSISFQVADNSC